jgi:hypothetical protein
VAPSAWSESCLRRGRLLGRRRLPRLALLGVGDELAQVQGAALEGVLDVVIDAVGQRVDLFLEHFDAVAGDQAAGRVRLEVGLDLFEGREEGLRLSRRDRRVGRVIAPAARDGEHGDGADRSQDRAWLEHRGDTSQVPPRIRQ